MSTGGEQKKPTEFLVALKINDRISKQNISTYLKKLKNIPNLSINLDVTGSNTQIFNEYGKQIKALEQQLEAFHLKLQNVGTESSAPLSIFENFKQGITDSLKSIDTLNEMFDDVHINVKEISKQLAKIPTGDLQSLQNLASQLKVEMETISTSQFKLYGIQEAQQNLQALESNLYNIYELQKAYTNTTDFEQLASQITDLNTQLTNIQLGEGLNIAGISDISNQIDKMSQSIVDFGNNANTAAQSSNKMGTTLIDGTKRAIELTELYNNTVSKIKPPPAIVENQNTTSEGGSTGASALSGITALSKGLLATTGVGALLLSAEAGLNFLFEKQAKTKAEAEKFANDVAMANKQLLASYEQNADTIDKLLPKYERLHEIVNNGNADTNTLSEYYDIQNKLTTLLPSLISDEDEYNRKIVGSVESVKIKTELLKEQLAIEKEKASLKENENNSKIIDKYEGNITDYNSQIQEQLKKFSTIYNSSFSQFSLPLLDEKGDLIYNSFEKLTELKEILNQKRNEALALGNNELANEYERLEHEVNYTSNLINNTNLNLADSTSKLKNAYITELESIINKNEDLKGSTKEFAQTISSELIFDSNADGIKNLQLALSTLLSGNNTSNLIEEMNSQFNKLYYATPEKFKEKEKEVSKYVDNLKDIFKTANPDMDESQLESIQTGAKNKLNNIINEFKKYNNVMNVTGLSLVNFTSKTSSSGNELDNLASKMRNYKDSSEEALGISSSYINVLDDSLFTYQEISKQLEDYSQQTLVDLLNKEKLTAAEQRIVDLYKTRNEILRDLSSVYPNIVNDESILMGISAEKINLMIAENKANDALLKAHKLNRENKLSEEQKATLELAIETNKRISIRNIEVQQLESKLAEHAKKIDEKPTSSSDLAKLQNEMAYHRAAATYEPKIKLKNAELIDLTNLKINYGEQLSKVGNSVTKLTNAEKNANKSTTQSIYITDKYKQKLEELNLGIEKQQRLLSKLPEHSSEYRRALETQIQFEKEKLRVMQQQEASLKNQIASGKIQQTGNITSKSLTSSTTTNLNGWSGKITSAYGGRKDPISGKPDFHLGMDISGSKGTRLDANVAGKIIASGDAVKNGYDDSYGNIVVVQDANNFKHLYAHLDKAIAKIGDYVDVGTQIGNIGASGTRVTGPHLHYEVKNGSGQRLDPTSYYTAAKNGATSSTSFTVDTTQQAIDQTKSELIGLQQQILNQKDLVEDLERDIIDSYLSSFENKKTTIDNLLETSDNRLRKLTVTSESYRKELDRQTAALNDKKKINQNEIAYLEGVIKSGTASKKVIDEYTQRLHELNNVNSEIDFAIWDVGSKKVESYMSKYEEQRQIQDNVIAYEKAKLGELDTSSARYVKSLVNINNAMKVKQNANLYELTQLKSLVNGNKAYGDGLQSAKKRIEELTIGMKELQVDIQDSDYDILINIKTQSDEKINNIESEINRAELIRKMFDEGSADYEKYTNIIINAQERIAQQHLETRDNLLEELKQRDITAERIKEITKLINEEYNGYLNATLAIKDYTKQKDDAKKAQLDKIADKVISAYKDYHQELRDEQIKQLDEEIERENKKHETIMKNLQEEMDLFRKSVEDKLRLIDREESQRSYDMEISDLESERNDVQSKLNILALDNSYEAKAKRKSLQEQLDEIDKTIAEKRHNREIDLRKESLNDALESKEEEINEKIELQESEHENLVNKINLEKEYWESYYSNLLNDESKFAKMREDIIAGHLTNVEANFTQYRDKLKASLPEISSVLDNTMKDVGMSIRNNVIFELEEALDLIKKFNDSQESKDNGSFESNLSNPQTSKGNLSNADLQVLLGKFLYDRVLPNVSGQDQSAVSEMAKNLAAKGRDKADSRFTENGANFNESTRILTQAEMDSLSEYFNSNKNLLGGKYNSFFEQFFNENSGNTQENRSKLSVADMKVMLGKFIYEKLVPEPSLNANTKMALKNKADNLASEGRNEDSQISENVTFDSVKNNYSSEQIQQLKTFFNSRLDMIVNLTTRELMKKKIASLDSGGFMNWTGIGIDGKGGKAIIAHPQEIMLNKADTQSLFNSINIMDSIMNNLSPFLLKFTPFQKSSSVSTGDTYGDIKINFHIDKMNGDKNDLNRFSKMIDDDLLRRKGMRK